MKRRTINGRAVCADPRYPDLTEKQYGLIQYLKREKARVGAYPTYREIERYFGFRSPNSVTQLLRALERKGYIERTTVGFRVTGS